MKFKTFGKKSGFIIAVLAVIVLGAFLRGYHFSDWLHFELDQARDAKIIDEAIDEGAGNLPLLGPRAAGSFLRLGPWFYYFEYISAKIFGNTPPGIAYVNLIFSVLTLPLFFFFCRRYFNKYMSLGLMLLFSVSLFMIMYSRFAWNPNLIPFFTLLSLYALLRISDREEKRREMWFYVLAVGIAIGTQFHFLAFLGLPIVTLLFLLIKRPSIKWRAWLISLLIVLFFYTPVIINDIKTGGDNFKEFIEAITGASDDDKHNIVEKVIRNTTSHSVAYFMILTSNEKAELFKVDVGKNVQETFDIRCDQGCRNNLWLGIISLFFFFGGILMLFKDFLKERHVHQKDFIHLVLIWFVVSFALFIPVAYDLAPRFFLLTAPIVFIFVGFILEFIGKHVKKNSWVVIVLILVLLVAVNLERVNNRFQELKKAPYEAVDNDPDRILKESNRFTYEQQMMIIDYIEDIWSKNKYIVYIHADSTYKRSLQFLIKEREMLYDGLGIGTIYQNGNHFLVLKAGSDQEERTWKYRQKYDIVEANDFGTMIVYYLSPKPEAVTRIEQKIDPNPSPSPSKAPKRYKWNEIFSSEGGEDDEELEE